MLWKKTWSPEAVLLLLGGILLAGFSGSLAAELLRSAGVAGFKTPVSPGNLLATTLCFHGTALVLGFAFLKFQGESLITAFGLRDPNLKSNLLLAGVVLVAVLPVMLGLKYVSEMAMHKLGWAAQDQDAVKLLHSVKSVWLRAYLGIFAVVVAPVAEEFFFRGVLFSAAQKLGWPKFGWIGVSLLFALIHHSAPAFVPLFVFALAQTWLYQTTDNLLAPIVTHSLFNATNLGLLFLQKS